MQTLFCNANLVHLQLKRAVELRPIITELAERDPNLLITENEWRIIRETVNLLHHPYHVTLLLQKINYTMSDFYAAWNQLKLLFTSLAPNNALAGKLDAQMNKEKIDRLLTNPLILGSVFLDPRVKAMIIQNREQCFVTKIYLSQLWSRVAEFEKKNLPATPSISTESDSQEIPLLFTFDLLEKYMNEDQPTEPMSPNVNIMDKLKEFESVPKEPMTTNIFKYWEENKERFPELYQLARIVHGAPPAQASCEQTFSQLTFVFNRYRAKLSERMLQNIMLIRLNKVLYHKIAEEEIERKQQKEPPVYDDEDILH